MFLMELQSEQPDELKTTYHPFNRQKSGPDPERSAIRVLQR